MRFRWLRMPSMRKRVKPDGRGYVPIMARFLAARSAFWQVRHRDFEVPWLRFKPRVRRHLPPDSVLRIPVPGDLFAHLCESVRVSANTQDIH